MARPREKSTRGIIITGTTIILLVLMVFGIGMRLINLGRWAYHHDESIHAWYAYRLCTYGRFDDGGGPIYRYDPVYHGPFLYHIGALFFALFGDNDFTGRLPFATFGILMMFLVYQLHHLIGKPRALVALAFVVLSPGLTYFSRFARNDVYFATETLAIILFALLYLRDRKTVWFCLLALSLALLYSTKENSYVTGFVLCSFLVGYFVVRTLWEAMFEKDWKRTLRLAFTDYFELTALIGLYGILSVFVFMYIRIPIEAQKEVLLEMAGRTADGSINRGIAQNGFNAYIADHQSFRWVVTIGGILAALIFLAGIHLIRILLENGGEGKEEPRAAEEKGLPGFLEGWVGSDIRLAIALVIILAVYVFLFTTMFSNAKGLVDGLTDYVRYWYAQKFKPRIAQTELGGFYYVYFFVIYDLAAFLLALAAMVYYAVRLVLRVISRFADREMDFPVPEENEPRLAIPVFQCYWALVVLVLYSILHERVPWLYTHMALPMAVLAGYFVGELYLRFRKWTWVWVPGAVAISVVAAFSLRANILLNLYRGDDPREVIVYVQSSKTVRNIMKEVEEVAYKAGTYENTMIGVSGSAQWPFAWYLRHYKSITGGRDRRYPINIADPKDHSQLQVVLGDDFEFKKYSFRDHWSPRYEEEFVGRKFSKKWWYNQLRYFFYRIPWSDVGGAELMLYRKRELREIPKVVEYPAGSDRPPRPGAFIKSWGRPGTENGEFSYPRGLAVSPDGHLYVCDSQNFRIQKFTLDGEFVMAFGGPTRGMGEGRFAQLHTGPGGVACDSKGFVYVADTWGHRIQKFTAEGEFVLQWEAGSPGKFFGPRDLAVDAEDRVYVADTGNKRILVYDTEGSFGRQIGREGSAPGEFIEPVGIDISGNHLFVADTGNKRIQMLTTTGRFLQQWNLSGWESTVVAAIEPYLAVTDDGTSYVTDSTRNCVYQFAPDGASVIVWGTFGSASGQLRRPTGVAVDGEGFVYVSDTDNHRINKYRKL